MSVYRVTEVIGTSSESFADAAKNAVDTAAASVRDLRVGEVVRQDAQDHRQGEDHLRAKGPARREGQEQNRDRLAESTSQDAHLRPPGLRQAEAAAHPGAATARAPAMRPRMRPELLA